MSQNVEERIVVNKNDVEKINMKRRKNFSSGDDEALCRAWITISMDAKVWAGQKMETFGIELQLSSTRLQIQIGCIEALNSKGVMFEKMCQSFMGLIPR